MDGPYFVLLRPVFYSCLCATKGTMAVLVTGAAHQHLCGLDVRGPKLRASCGVLSPEGAFLRLETIPVIQGACDLLLLLLFWKKN